ncbi:hypothetical protein D8B26_004246 [Coccidioides posadasii str. Silveira]|uniref:WD domain, G-beta repeat containing protein n=1 Tax=Coccidioides posadasii (strain C735) TaxID=222929 RepID=C5PJ11_COCP7|nr:WD domain, G-beta repeat containing protein [Coccidioides posadasii C735 delta SOWgp]EER22960.1 WD domain, G-beta repeat containing protein [Coccidioides posadasii C735 delta SOWgp]QVM09591.1 hypothetical protein D8B26_004246 [Coccidioides posadasii str. Silveira]|eukprot:XP_003065105.1 WD domain, G-beta repeat containing protein [Coccidioides posadasii C735 delta SOWgp]
MNSYLLNRSQGSICPSSFHAAQCSRLIQCLAPAPGIRFSSASASTTDGDEVWAHKAGVNVLAIDHYDRRFMVSGGADASVHLWDFESRGAQSTHLHRSIASVSKSSNTSAHTHALTSISIYPFDPTPATVLTTSHDTTLKLSSIGESEITPVHTFSLHSTPYSHSLSSHPSSHLLIGVGTSDKAVRLLDLRSGLSTHSLPGHTGAVLSVQWAPHNPHLIASASKDNRVLIFDVRRGGHNSTIASLDMDDAVGVLPPPTAPPTFHPRKPFARGSRAHNGAVTGVRWSPQGDFIITAGQDSRLRVWDATTGANTLVHFGPRIRNSASMHLAERAPLVVPDNVSAQEAPFFLWPNYSDPDDRGEIFIFSIRNEGELVTHLKVPGIPSRERMRAIGKPSALTAARINTLTWRGNGGAGEGMEMFSGHGDGTIRCWASRTEEEIDEIEAEREETEMEERKRKRDVLEELYRGLMQPGVTFT